MNQTERLLYGAMLRYHPLSPPTVHIDRGGRQRPDRKNGNRSPKYSKVQWVRNQQTVRDQVPPHVDRDFELVPAESVYSSNNP